MSPEGNLMWPEGSIFPVHFCQGCDIDSKSALCLVFDVILVQYHTPARHIMENMPPNARAKNYVARGQHNVARGWHISSVLLSEV